MDYSTIFVRVAAWNAARYERVFNLKLLLDLLNEEYKETCDAQAEVDILDGRCDQAYVALGGIWKLDLPEEVMALAFAEAGVTIDQLLKADMLQGSDFDTAIALNINAIGNPNLGLTPYQQAACLAMICLLNHCAAEFEFNVGFYDALTIVCDSNDSKEIKKVSADVKANIVKGAGFVKPEPRLQALLDGAKEHVKH